MTVPEPLREPPDFSLVLGGPLYQMLRRARLSGPTLELLKRRVLWVIAITWLPLLLLSIIGGRLLGDQGLPFLHDIETHVRFLIALPLLVIAELVVHQLIRPLLILLVERRIVTTEDTPRFYASIETAMKMRNSAPLELALLIFAFTVGIWAWMNEVALGTASWYADPYGSNLHLTLPGYWCAFVSIPIIQFILFRWYMRLVIWAWLLWRISRLNLRLLPTHPDRAGGIGFLADSSYAFAPIMCAQSTVLAGVIAGRILYDGQSLMSFNVTIVALIGFFVLIIFVPLTVFIPHLARAKRRGLDEYGTLATTYVSDFDEKWLRGGAKDEAILGTSDIQSLADLANSYSVVHDMRIVPFSLHDIARVAVVTVMPVLPLLLTIMPLHELLTRLMKIIF